MENALIRFNEWWKTGFVPQDLTKNYKRHLFDDILKYIDKKQIIKIYGLRRTGKTTLFYQIIEYLIANKTNPKHILYFSFDEKISEIREILEVYTTKIIQKELRKLEKIYVFLDEIQKLDDWQNKIKIFYDLYPNIKFFISGSSSLELKKGTGESLAGRIFDFRLNTLNFKEFIQLKDEKLYAAVRKINMANISEKSADLNLFRNELKIYFANFLKTGGFIEIINEDDEKIIRNYIRSSIVDKILFQDIPKTYKINDPNLLLQILKIVADNPGMLADFSSFANDLNVTRQTISNYFFYLEQSLMIKLLFNYSKSMSTSAKKLKKAFLNNTSFIYTLLEKQVDDQLYGKIVESLVACTTSSDYFLRKNGFEIDILIKIDDELVPVEVKYRNTANPQKGLIKFMKKYNLKQGIVITKDTFEKREELLFVPAYLFLLIV